MNKLVENLSVNDYGEVEDILYELLQEHYEIEGFNFDSLEKDIEYVTGTINIVKLGNKPNTLKHKQYVNEQWTWSNDVEVSESYEFATYYILDKLNDVCKNVLTGSWSETYNFNRILNSMN